MLGLSAEDLAKKSPAAAFKDIAEATNNLADQSEKAFVATKLFGRAGVKLVNTLALGKSGLNDMTKEAKRLGIAFTRIDAAKVEQANDAVSRLKMVFTGVVNTLTIQVAPLITKVADDIRKVGDNGTGMRDVVVAGFEKLVAAGGSFIDVLTGIEAGFLGLIVVQKQLELAALKPASGFDKFTRSVASSIREAAGFSAIDIGKYELAALSIQSEIDRLEITAGELFEKATSGTARQKFIDGFREATDLAEKAGQAQIDAAEKARAAAAGKQDGAKALARKDRTAQFREINIARTALGGPQQLNKPQKVEDPQLALTNKTLINIWRGLGQAFSAPQEVGP